MKNEMNIKIVKSILPKVVKKLDIVNGWYMIDDLTEWCKNNNYEDDWLYISCWLEDTYNIKLAFHKEQMI